MQETNLLSEKDALEKERTILSNERTRLSAERTVSSWIRTGLASVGGGLAIIRFVVFKNVNNILIVHAIGEALIIWGIFILFFSLKDYRDSCKKLELAERKNEWWITTTIVIFALVSLSLFFVTLIEAL